MSSRGHTSVSLTKCAPTFPAVSDLDFCNAFWGEGDGGVEVLWARMCGAAGTIEELRDFWKERSRIEEEYANGFARLAKMPLGKDEIGALRSAIDVLRQEMDEQAGVHARLARWIRTHLEGQVRGLVVEQRHHAKAYQGTIETQLKTKRTRERRACKAREKYASDCLRVDSCAAKLAQAKDLESAQLELEQAQQAARASENEYVQEARALREAMREWEGDWKAFCDSCQDLEEKRLAFMKDNMSAYAKAVSMVCVSDDESYGKLRVALEQMEPRNDMEKFVKSYGTGNMIPEPPVDYVNTGMSPSLSPHVGMRPSNFARSTWTPRRAATLRQDNVANTDKDAVSCTFTDVTLSSKSATKKSTATSRSPANGVDGHNPPFREPQKRQAIAVAPGKPILGDDLVDSDISSTLARARIPSGKKLFCCAHRHRGNSSTPSPSSPSAVSPYSASSDPPMTASAVLPPPLVLPLSNLPVGSMVNGNKRPFSSGPPSRSKSYVGPLPGISLYADSVPRRVSEGKCLDVSASHLSSPARAPGSTTQRPATSNGVLDRPVAASRGPVMPTKSVYGPPSQHTQSPQQPPPSDNCSVVTPTGFGAAESDNCDHPPPPAYGEYCVQAPTYGQLGSAEENHAGDVRDVSLALRDTRDIAADASQRDAGRASAASFGSTSTLGGSSAPTSPTTSRTDDGRPILFYVKALYDYSATIDEEVDLQAGDIIAVTDAHADGWWSGELLDDTRRQAGRHLFPSNFVSVF